MSVFSKITEVAARLKEVEDERRLLRQQLKDLIAQHNGTGAEPEPVGAIPSRIETMMADRPTTEFTADEVAKALGIDANVARTTLARMASKGQVRKTGRGKYGYREEEDDEDELAPAPSDDDIPF